MKGGQIFGFVIVILVLLAIDLYAFKGVRTITKSWSSVFWKQCVQISYWLVTAMYVGGMVFAMIKGGPHRNMWDYKFMTMLMAFTLVFFVPKLIFIVFHLVEDISYGLTWLYQKIFSPPKVRWTDVPTMDRWTFISKVGLGLAAIPFAGMIYGIAKGRYNFKVRKEILHFSDLPKAFDGLKVAQISDLHIGSFFNDHAAVKKGFDMINELDADVLFFTGDWVNNYAEEMDGWEELISGLKGKMGKYAILGNHDYGDYGRWDSDDQKVANLEKLKTTIKTTGFDLLLNENRTFEHKGEKMGIIGVENWGAGGFAKYGDLEKAKVGTEDLPFNILLSHDPSHWEEQVKEHTDIDLTLSGHTHGMQFGVEIPGIKWSPVQWRYPRWAGLYNVGKQFLYVNRGFGYIGFPGRVGIMPEITFLELRSGVA